MHIVLLSGGSGKRLWPLSDAVQVKQFLPFLKDEQGQDESMLQRVYRQVKEAVPSFDCMIATSQSQIDNIRAQLPGTEIPVSVEPALKDTFWAAVLSAAYLRDVLHKDEEEAMMLFPVDPFVDASFFATAKEMDSILQTGQVNVGIVGITPTSPSEKYGYIFRQDEKKVSKVTRFVEKPKSDFAEQAIKEGALWDAGVFAFKIRYIMKLAEQYTNYRTYSELYQHYRELDKISFYYEICQKEKNMAVIHYPFSWKDIGTWNTLSEEMTEQLMGNVILDEKCVDTHVLNYLDIPIIGLGLNQMVVVANENGILVTEKKRSSFIKPYVEQIEKVHKDSRRDWGRFLVMLKEPDYSCIQVNLLSNNCIEPVTNNCRRHFVCLEGKGVLIKEDRETKICPGDTWEITSGTDYRLSAIQSFKWMETQFDHTIQEYKNIPG